MDQGIKVMMRVVALVVAVHLGGATLAAAQERWAEKMFMKEGSREVETSHDFGSVPHGAQLYYRFPMTNIYAVPLEIKDVHVSCGCVKARAAAKTLGVKESSYIEINMDTTIFTQSKTVEVKVWIGDGAQFSSTAILKVSAFSRRDVVFNPGQANFAIVDQGATPTKTVDLEYAGALAPTWAVTEVTTGSAPVETTLKEMYRKDGRVGYQIGVTLKKDAPAGPLQQEIFLKTNDPASPSVPLFVTAVVEAPLTVSPDRWDVAGSKAGTEVSRRFQLRTSSGKEFRVLGVEGLDPDFSLGTELPTTAKAVHILLIKFKPAQAGEVKRELRIKTDLQEKPIVVTIDGTVP